MASQADSSSRHWLVVPFVALLAALPTALASLEPFRFGYWDKAEPVVVWLHLCSGLGAVGLTAGLWAGRPAFAAAIRHPYVLVSLAMVLWSVVAAPFAELPVLSLSGTPQSGLGAMWFLDLAVLVACALVVWNDRLMAQWLEYVALGTVAVVAGVKALDYTGRPITDTLLLYVPSYYGWLGVVLPLVIGFGGGRGVKWPKIAVAGLVSVAGVGMAFSLTAWVLLLVVWSLVLSPSLPTAHPLRRAAGNRTLGVIATAAAALLPPAAIRILGNWSTGESLRDRLHLQDMVLAALRQDPAPLFGHGWGRVQDAFHANLNVTGENLWQATWIFLSSDYFSSHNWLLDTLHAVGFPGAAAALCGFLALPWFAPAERRSAATALAVASGVIGAVWFQLGFSLPFFALAMAAVAAPSPGLPTASRRPIACATAVAAVAQLALAGLLFDFGRQVAAVHRDIALAAPSGRPWPSDWRGSDLEVTEAIRDAFNDLAKTGHPRPEAVPAVKAMFATLRTRIPETVTVQTAVTGLGVLSYVHFSRELAWLAPELPDSQALWRPWLERLLLLAPGRSDQAIPYLTWRATMGDLADVQAFSSRLLAVDPKDAVGLYFRGLVQILSPEPTLKQAGVESFRAARAHGIERFMPLDPVILRLIGA